MAVRKNIPDLIKEAKEKKLKKLEFYKFNFSFDTIPDEVYDLINLEELQIKFSGAKISKKIQKLKNLKILKVDGQFVKFPMELLEMESLQELTLSSETLKEIPTELDNWQSL